MANQRFKTALFIAWRHLFSKKKHSLVNIIAIISAIGVLTGTAALVIVLSVFNGMEDLVVKSFNSFNPDFRITLKEGKSFATDSFPYEKIRQIQGIKAVEEVVSDLVLLEYEGKQHLIELKGISKNHIQQSGLDTLLLAGDFNLQPAGEDGGVMGAIAAGTLQLNLQGADYIKVYYPKRLRKNLGNPTDAFQTRYLKPVGIFASYTEYDEKFLICSLDFARNLMSYENQVTAIEIFIQNEQEINTIQKEIEALAGDRFVVQNRYQQEALLFKTIKSEKLIIFVILAFILLIAIFNIIGTLAMIIIEKKDDILILNYIGADRKMIRNIFLYEGMIISFIGGLVGMLLGALVCWMQQTFHIIALNNAIIGYYPVKMELGDFLIVFATIFFISLIVSVIPSQKIHPKKDIEQ